MPASPPLPSDSLLSLDPRAILEDDPTALDHGQSCQARVAPTGAYDHVSDPFQQNVDSQPPNSHLYENQPVGVEDLDSTSPNKTTLFEGLPSYLITPDNLTTLTEVSLESLAENEIEESARNLANQLDPRHETKLFDLLIRMESLSMADEKLLLSVARDARKSRKRKRHCAVTSVSKKPITSALSKTALAVTPKTTKYCLKHDVYLTGPWDIKRHYKYSHSPEIIFVCICKKCNQETLADRSWLRVDSFVNHLRNKSHHGTCREGREYNLETHRCVRHTLVIAEGDSMVECTPLPGGSCCGTPRSLPSYSYQHTSQPTPLLLPTASRHPSPAAQAEATSDITSASTLPRQAMQSLRALTIGSLDPQLVEALPGFANSGDQWRNHGTVLIGANINTGIAQARSSHISSTMTPRTSTNSGPGLTSVTSLWGGCSAPALRQNGLQSSSSIRSKRRRDDRSLSSSPSIRGPPYQRARSEATSEDFIRHGLFGTDIDHARLATQSTLAGVIGGNSSDVDSLETQENAEVAFPPQPVIRQNALVEPFGIIPVDEEPWHPTYRDSSLHKSVEEQPRSPSLQRPMEEFESNYVPTTPTRGGSLEFVPEFYDLPSGSEYTTAVNIRQQALVTTSELFNPQSTSSSPSANSRLPPLDSECVSPVLRTPERISANDDTLLEENTLDNLLSLYEAEKWQEEIERSQFQLQEDRIYD